MKTVMDIFVADNQNSFLNLTHTGNVTTDFP